MEVSKILVRLFYISFILVLISCGTDDPEQMAPIDPEISVETQKIILNAEDYKHQFIGGGVSIGLFLGHHYSMSEASQDEAIRLMVKDCNMKYLQDYIQIYPSDDPSYFDRRANYIKAAKIYRPEIEFSLVGNKFPDDLMKELVVGGETLQVLDTDDPDIYDRLAQWFFRLFKGFSDRGVSVEILNVVNEPDLDRTFRKYHYGLNGNTKEAVARIFKYAVPKFKEMLNDPSINTTNMQVPLIMGPSTISPVGCLDYMRFFKDQHPDVWDQIDIIATHQYENGAVPSLFTNIMAEADGKILYQSETHALKGDALGSLSVDRPLEAALSLSNLFGTAVRNGVSSWFYFENNYPNEFHPGGLIQVAWAAPQPKPYKHFYAFKQLTSAQPDSSHVISSTTNYNSNSEVTAFRKMGQDTLFMHYSNYTTEAKEITVIANNNSQETLKINGYWITTTDENNNEVVLDYEEYQSALDSISFSAGRYSINTVKISIVNE
ncbi:hypothetical protein [uncultured Aquimarina sp.]|uniref:hypothetical protein n=1 Tax=uncultured Aquimarina sp. TaxID=575652 RepID=UPI002632FDDC|nr:hypothetical protein [uncultured Aquimarina sp.]